MTASESSIPQNDDLSLQPSQDAKQKVKQFSLDAKFAAKKILHLNVTKEKADKNDNFVAQRVDENPAFNPAQTLDVEAGTVEQIKAKIPKPHSAKEFGHIIRHPKEAFQEEASKTLDASENPHLSRDEDQELIEKHSKLSSLETSDNQAPQATNTEAHLLREQIQELEDDREEKQVAWTTSRYVAGARTIPAGFSDLPLLSSCRWVDNRGFPQGALWNQWTEQAELFVHQLRHAPPSPGPDETASIKNEDEDEAEESGYDQEILMQEVERIILSSNPLQRWISDLRKLRNWQNPLQTTFWLAIWLTAWLYDRLFMVVYLLLALRLVQTRSAFDKRQSLKETHERADNDEEMSNTISEMITQHGSNNWLQPTLDTIGPMIQPTTRKVADWLEIFIAYPERKTWRALVCMQAALILAMLVSIYATAAVCVRTAELILILVFFVDKPLSGRYSKYRSLIVPLHWIFWNIGNTTEDSFEYLRRNAEILRSRSSQSPSKRFVNEDILVADCNWRNISGTVALTTHDLRFIRNAPKQELWRRKFDDVTEMHKGDGRTSLLKRVVHVIEFQFSDGKVEKLRHCKKNDEIFNLVFAFSKTQWQQV